MQPSSTETFENRLGHLLRPLTNLFSPLLYQLLVCKKEKKLQAGMKTLCESNHAMVKRAQALSKPLFWLSSSIFTIWM